MIPESLKSDHFVLEAEQKVEQSHFLQAIETFEKALKNVGGLSELAYLYHRRAYCKLCLGNCDEALKEAKLALQMANGVDMEIESIRIHALRCMIYSEMILKATDQSHQDNYASLYVEDFRKAIEILKNWKYLPPMEKIELNPNPPNPKGAVLILHGYGADASDLSSGVGDAMQKLLPSMRLIFPQGAYPIRKLPWVPFVGYSWYAEDVPRDSYGWYSYAPRDLLPYAQMYKLLDDLRKDGIKNQNVVLMGFSQGATVACITSILHNKDFLGGIICCSGGNFGDINEHVIEFLLKQAASKVPVLIGGGTKDDKVPISHIRELHELYKNRTFNVEYHEYPMMHQIIPEQIEHIVSFVHKHLS